MEQSNFRILVVDDETDILEFITYNLKNEGFNVNTCRNGKDAVEMAKKHKPHLILLDVMMPEMDGVEACEIIRRISGLENTIIAFLTARGEDYSQIAGFEAGADDYIVKPIKPKVLVSRIKALLKRIPSGKQDEPKKKKVKWEDLIIDHEKYLVYLGKKEISLPKKEFELLTLLMSKPGRVFTREEIFRGVWGDDIIVGDRTIDVHIRKIREKIGEKTIKTVKGVGYKIKV